MEKSKKKDFLKNIYVKKYKEKKKQEFINNKIIKEYKIKSYVNVIDRIINNLSSRTNSELKKRILKEILNIQKF